MSKALRLQRAAMRRNALPGRRWILIQNRQQLPGGRFRRNALPGRRWILITMLSTWRRCRQKCRNALPGRRWILMVVVVTVRDKNVMS